MAKKRKTRGKPLRLEWVVASELRGNPENWRRHPDRQRRALDALFDNVGWAGALLYNERTQRLIDGHLRQELAGDRVVPVLIGSWTAAQERQILVGLDPVAGMAEVGAAELRQLVDATDLSGMDDIAAELDQMLGVKPGDSGPDPDGRTDSGEGSTADPVPMTYHVVIDCEDETAQIKLTERLRAEGLAVRTLSFPATILATEQQP